MNMPGFTAEVSLYKTGGSYQRIEPRAYNVGAQNVISQLSAGGFPGGGGSGLFGGWWCRFGCAFARSSCLDGCEGTLDNPKPSMNCVICDQTYRACVQGCDGPTKS
jgi:hypothetical protein